MFPGRGRPVESPGDVCECDVVVEGVVQEEEEEEAEEEVLPGEQPLGDGAGDKGSPRPPSTGVISTLLISSPFHTHTLTRCHHE